MLEKRDIAVLTKKRPQNGYFQNQGILEEPSPLGFFDAVNQPNHKARYPSDQQIPVIND